MNKLTLKLNNVSKLRPIVIVDGQKIKMSKVDKGSLSGEFETEKETVNLNIYTVPCELENKYWIWLSIMYYFVSIFGIFDIWYGSNFYKMNYVSEIKLKENTNLELNTNVPMKGAKVFESQDEIFVDNDTNVFQYNEKLKKRKWTIYSIRFGSWILISLIIVLCIIF